MPSQPSLIICAPVMFSEASTVVIVRARGVGIFSAWVDTDRWACLAVRGRGSASPPTAASTHLEVGRCLVNGPSLGTRQDRASQSHLRTLAAYSSTHRPGRGRSVPDSPYRDRQGGPCSPVCRRMVRPVHSYRRTIHPSHRPTYTHIVHDVGVGGSG